MFKVNEYFDGTVKSIAFGMAEGPATIGVMAAGEYEFGTNQLEIMHVVAGALSVKTARQRKLGDLHQRQPLHRTGQQQIPTQGRDGYCLPV